jgi:ribonuclease Z
MPEALLEPMKAIMKIWAAIEDHTYDYDFHIAQSQQDFTLKGNYFFRTFPTYHRVPSTGYTIFERKKRLKQQFRGQTPEQLGRLRNAGTEIDEKYVANVLSFTGDTKIEFLQSEQARQSQVLVMEVTFWDEKRGVQAARDWGHTHIDELLPWLPQIQSEKIVLIHNSVRYSLTDLQNILAQKVSARDLARIELFPRSR